MSRQEFLNGLRNALAGKLSPAEIEKQVEYYDNYILSEARKGRREEEVLQELGDPRLIAKSIIASAGVSDSLEETYEETNDKDSNGFTLTGWPAAIVIIAIALVIIVVVVKIAIFLMPVILMVLAVLAIMYLIRNLKQ